MEPVSDLSGVSIYIIKLVENLPADSFDVHFVSSDNGEAIRYLQDAKVTVHTIKDVDYGYGPITFFQALFRLSVLVKKFQPDILFANTLRSGVLAAFLSLFLNIKLVYHGHGWRFSQKRGSLSRAVFFLLDFFTCFRSDLVISLSEEERGIGINHHLIDKSRSVIIPPLINIESFRSARTKSFAYGNRVSFPLDSFVVGMIGRLAPQKDPETFVRTARVILDKIPNARFLWVGSGSLRTRIEGIIDEVSLGESFTILDSVPFFPKNDIPAVLSLIDVMLFTSECEGLSASMLEAMLSYKDIVAPSSPGIEGLITEGETGKMYQRGDCNEAASAVLAIFENRDKTLATRERAYRLAVSKCVSPLDGAKIFSNSLNKLIKKYD